MPEATDVWLERTRTPVISLHSAASRIVVACAGCRTPSVTPLRYKPSCDVFQQIYQFTCTTGSQVWCYKWHTSERFLSTQCNMCLQPVTHNQNKKSCTLALLVTSEVGLQDKPYQCGRDRISPPSQNGFLYSTFSLHWFPPPDHDKGLTSLHCSGLGGAGPCRGLPHTYIAGNTATSWLCYNMQTNLQKHKKLGSVGYMHSYFAKKYSKNFMCVTKIPFLVK